VFGAYSPEALPFVAEGRTWSPGMISVTRPVYSSTTVTAVNLDSSRAQDSNPQPCYPDICFAVDNFDNTFEDLVSHTAGRICPGSGCPPVQQPQRAPFTAFQSSLCLQVMSMVCTMLNACSSA